MVQAKLSYTMFGVSIHIADSTQDTHGIHGIRSGASYYTKEFGSGKLVSRRQLCHAHTFDTIYMMK